ncbi:MAG TPA: hypothetical protein VNL14_04235 [Candidatus Acidoferrales bacterium]|nr:hypothetical protein [Candidatus Acidoferrales bacterium]
MRRAAMLFFAVISLTVTSALFSGEAGKYPPPRFPSYVKPPKSIEDVMPFARAAVRQTGGRTPLGLVEKGMTVAIFTEPTAEDMIIQAIRKAYEERGVKVQMVPEHQLLGVSREEALKAIDAVRWYTSEHGYMEAHRWITQRFADPEVPKKWLRERRPDLYKAMFEKTETAPPQLVELGRKFGGQATAREIVKYLDQHPEVNVVFWRRGGRTATRKSLEPHGSKFYGNFIFDNRYELMNKASTFPGDVWRLAEERVIEPLSWIDRVHVTDPEGTNFAFELDEKQAQAWAKGAYQQGHLFMFPHQATGRFPYSSVEYPAFTKEYNPRYLIKVNGVFAGTNNHTGSFPRIEVHVKDGYVREVKGGGLYGEVWREFLKYPKINELTYPYHDRPGYWWIYEAGLGTNPKFFKRPDENMEGTNSSERNNAGVIHWGFGLRLDHGPDKPVESKEWAEFAKHNGLPDDHWWHIHNLLVTYRVRVRGTKNTWLTLIDKGQLTALHSPEIRALASRYGDPQEVLSDDWAPHIPGVNAPGRFEDYARDPWKTLVQVMKKIEAGTYEYFYPPVKAKK